MNILALDLGTHTGYCHTSPVAGGVVAGTWDLANKKEIAAWNKNRLIRRRDPRISRFAEKLAVVDPRPDVVVFEDVQFQTYTYQTQLWASFRAAVWLSFPAPVIVDCVPVQTLKQFATGWGGADKEKMMLALRKKYPEWAGVEMDDNEADAIWIYKWTEHNLGRLKV